MSVTVRELYSYLNEYIPQSLSAEWDNDGLMVAADENSPVKKILFTLDVTDGAISYAIENGFDVIISHHPLIFKPIKSLAPVDATSKRAIKALLSGVAVMSFHTRLDALKGGVNDVLAELLEIEGAVPFGPEGEEFGRVGAVEPMETDLFASKVKSVLGADAVVVTDCGKKVSKVAMLGGDGKDYVNAAIKAGADTYVTGRCGYNVDVDARDLGINVIEAGHYHTEAPVLKRLSEIIGKRFAGILFGYYNSSPNYTI